MFRLLALLQLTRAALAFTAIADAWTILLLRPPGEPAAPIPIVILRMIVLAVASFGLYGFGMSLNDLLDARRDRIFSPRRPIPSGRIQPRSAVIVSLSLLMFALLAATFMTPLNLIGRTSADPLSSSDFMPYSFLFAISAAALIVLYDATSKYLGGLGLVTLGAIRALHCLIGHPKTPLLFLSMILLTHVIVISTIAYRLENKRPRLKKSDYLAVTLGILIGNALALWYMHARGALVPANFQMLLGPAIAALTYTAWAILVLKSAKLSPRQKGERLMLLGLFWLFVYDASMLLSNGQYLAGIAITLLLLCAILSFFGIRFLSRAISMPKVGYRTERGTLPPSSPTPGSAAL